MSYFKDKTPVQMIFSGLARGESYALMCVIETTQSSATNRKSINYTINAEGTGNSSVNFIPTPVDSTVCINFRSSLVLSDSDKSLIMGWCQSSYSKSSAKPVTGGCVMCTDSNGKVLPGFTVPKNVTCPSAVRRLRYLTAMTTDPVVPVVVVPPTTFDYLVCAVQPVTCNSNVNTVTARVRSLATQTGLASVIMNVVLPGLKDFDSITASLGKNITSFLSTTTISDSVAPIVAYTKGTSSNQKSGFYSVIINYNATTSYDCYYQVSAGTTAPTAASIKGCTSTTNCGMWVLKAPGGTIEGTASPAFTVGTAYSVFFTCYNRVPGAQLASAVTTAYTFTPVCPVGTELKEGACNKITPPKPTVAPPTNTTSSNFVFVSLTALVAMMFMLFD